MEMGIHQLTQVVSIPSVLGNLRLATERDRPLLLEWSADFLAKIGDVARGETAEQMVDRGLKQKSMYLWQVDSSPEVLSPEVLSPETLPPKARLTGNGSVTIPVSLACGSQFLPTAARIGPVYTPPQYRRKGYATACVSTLSQQFLDQNCQNCFLFTDLANPTSNGIYHAIGYQLICHWHDWGFPSSFSL
jgi:predicted GNAT family acetyltransferase